eukprot:jgi/Mesen1/10154/ME000076S09664
MAAANMRAGTVSQAAGSAYAEFGDTKVLVAVYGPREGRGAQSFSSHGRLACDVKVASFATPVRGRYSGMDEKEMASLMQRALEGAVVLASFPKATVDIFAIVLASGGGTATHATAMTGVKCDNEPGVWG